MEEVFEWNGYGSFHYNLIAGSLLIYILYLYINGKRKDRELLNNETDLKITNEKTRIATEMHDDIGADLSNILFKLKIYQSTHESKNAQAYLEIEQDTNAIIKKLNETIWSLNSDKDSLKSLENFMLKYLDDLLYKENITFKFNQLQSTSDIPVDIEKRRGLFHLFKATINYIISIPTVKHIDVRLHFEENEFIILITFNGTIEDTEENKNKYQQISEKADRLNAKLDLQNIPANENQITITLKL